MALMSVAPPAGAWIETGNKTVTSTETGSRPPRARGLKHAAASVGATELCLTLIHKYPELPNGVLATSSFPKFKGKVGIGFCFDPGSLGEDM